MSPNLSPLCVGELAWRRLRSDSWFIGTFLGRWRLRSKTEWPLWRWRLRYTGLLRSWGGGGWCYMDWDCCHELEGWKMHVVERMIVEDLVEFTTLPANFKPSNVWSKGENDFGIDEENAGLWVSEINKAITGRTLSSRN